MKRLVLLAVASACASFEDPTLVIDLRVIAMTATPPEQVIDLDVDQPPKLSDLIDQLASSTVCATVADPGRSSSLRWSMTACLTDNGRCDPTLPSIELGGGEVLDPDLTGAPICATLEPSSSLVALLVEVYNADTFRGLSGLTYSVEFRVGAVDAPSDDDQFALKDLHVFARFPEDRVANHNPMLHEMQVLTPGLHLPPLVPCAIDRERFSVKAREKVELVPVERPDTRELYPVLTVDGSFEQFDETIRYQYLATGGSLGSETGGGPPDFAGNLPRLGTSWIAPDVTSAVDVQLWINQRDERGGTSVYPMCIRVTP